MKLIYGGTFDPIHIGHLRLAIALREAFDVDEVNLVPCHVPPHRDQTGASSDQRLKLLELAIANEPGLCIDRRELAREGASYTVDTLREIRHEIGSSRALCMVVGTDAFESIDRWHQWRELLTLAHIIVVVRPGAPMPTRGLAAQLFEEHRVDSVTELKALPAGRIFQFETPGIDVSATDIRTRIAAGLSVRFLVPDPVLQEIRNQNLYRACPDGGN